MTKSEKRNMENSFKIFHPVRTVNPNHHRFIGIPHDFMTHPNFISLSPNAKIIYLYMTDYATYNIREFPFPRKIYKGLVCNSTFEKAIKELEEHGFIEKTFNGKPYMKENLYSFIESWKTYKVEKKRKRKTKIVENKKLIK